MSANHVHAVLGLIAAGLLVGCEQKSTWYDQSVAGTAAKNERIEQFKLQGMDQVTAQKTADFESFWRNTEMMGRNPAAVEGADLQNALSHPGQ